MSSLNKVQIIGNVTQDIELRKTQSGISVANLSVATNEQWTDKASGQKKEKAEFHRVVLWDKLADIAAQYLTKGAKVYIEGKLETRSWDDQNGQKKYATEIVVKGYGGNMVMLGGQQSGQSSHNQAKADGYQPQGGYDDMEDDIPFAAVSRRIMA